VVTIYQVVEEDGQSFAIPQYQFAWPKITDPNGTVRDYIAYPGTCVPHDVHGCSQEYTPSSAVADMGWKKEVSIQYYDDVFPAKIPVNYQYACYAMMCCLFESFLIFVSFCSIGCMGLPPASHDFVDSIPPMVTGGNLDNTRIAAGTTMYYPVQVKGGLLSMGDAHAVQAGTCIQED
jgi:Acetamidase/Formamidase family